MRKRLRWDLQGTTKVRVTGPEPWRFLRRCAEDGILLTDAKAEDAFACLVCLLTRDLPRAQRIAGRCSCVRN